MDVTLTEIVMDFENFGPAPWTTAPQPAGDGAGRWLLGAAPSLREDQLFCDIRAAFPATFLLDD